MKIKLPESRDLTRVFYNVRENEYYVIHDSSFRVLEFSYEDHDMNTNSYYAVSRSDIEQANIPNIMHENGIFEIPVFEFFVDHNLPTNMHIVADLEGEGVITVLSESEFEKFTGNKTYGQDYKVFDHNEEEVKPTEVFVQDAPPITNFDRRKAERAREQVRRDLNTDSIYDVPVRDVISYARKSKENYKKVQYMYVNMDTAVRVKDTRKQFWYDVADELNFPDDVTID